MRHNHYYVVRKCGYALSVKSLENIRGFFCLREHIKVQTDTSSF